jgi:hypothetical protein
MVMNKKGWIRILEATVGILIVSGVLVAVYSKQINQPDANDFIFSMQKKILMDISSRSDLRMMVLRSSETDLQALDVFVNQSMPGSYGYSLRVCDLGDACTLQGGIAILNFREDSDVFVEEAIISAVVSGSGQAYDPKKVRLFVWEAK